MIRLVEKYPIVSLLLFVVIMLGFTIDAIPVSIMEARNFISAREMLTDDNWILTTMNGEARYQKPPLPTWITAAFGYVFGIANVLALRWPALLFLAFTGITIYLFSKKLELQKSHSLLNGFIALSSFYCIGITVEAPWDIYAHGFMIMAIYQLFQLLQKKTTDIVGSLLVVLFLSGSVLSKGPVSLYALFLPFLISYGITYKYKGGIVHFLKILSLIIFGIVLGGWWFFHVRFTDPATFTAIAERETSNWNSYNVRPFYYYWSFFVQSGMWTIPAFISLLYPYLKSRVRNLKAYKFSFFWTILAVVLLSLIPEKKSRYLMPVLIPLAFNIGFYIDYLVREFKNLKAKKEIIPVFFHFGLIASICVLFWISGFFFGPFLSGSVLIRFIITALILLIIGIFIFKSLKIKNIKKSFYLTLVFIMSLGFLGLPLINTQQQSDYNPVSSLNENKLKLYSLGGVAPEVIYNYGAKIPSISSEEGFIIPDASEFHLLTSTKASEAIDELSKYFELEYVETFDLNTVEKDAKAYKSRLVNTLYKLTRK